MMCPIIGEKQNISLWAGTSTVHTCWTCHVTGGKNLFIWAEHQFPECLSVSVTIIHRDRIIVYSVKVASSKFAKLYSMISLTLSSFCMYLDSIRLFFAKSSELEPYWLIMHAEASGKYTSILDSASRYCISVRITPCFWTVSRVILKVYKSIYSQWYTGGMIF